MLAWKDDFGTRSNMSGELGRAEREWAKDCGSMKCGAIYAIIVMEVPYGTDCITGENGV